MQSPTLVVMAAGAGSRFGGPKQLMSVDDAGHPIIDFSLYDARRAGFQKVVFIIKHAIEEDFKAVIGRRMERFFDVNYVFQELDVLPNGYSVPEGRTKPWGTAHAVSCCRGTVTGPFAVINADDFYGRGAFSALYGFLSAGGDAHTHALVAYRLRNTLTENGTVARGVCTADEAGHLLTVTEHTAIQGPAEDPSFTEDGGATWTPLDPDAPVSLNTWGFQPGFLDAIEEELGRFLRDTMPGAPEKAEFFLPGVVNARLEAGKDRVRLLHTDDKWHGVTYREDLPALQRALEEMRAAGVYPARLWE